MSRLAMFILWLVAQGAHVVASVRMLGFILTGSVRGEAILRAYDRLGNVGIGGDDRETISSRANRNQATSRRWCLLCRILDKLDPDHCKKSAGI